MSLLQEQRERKVESKSMFPFFPLTTCLCRLWTETASFSMKKEVPKFCLHDLLLFSIIKMSTYLIEMT